MQINQNFCPKTKIIVPKVCYRICEWDFKTIFMILAKNVDSLAYFSMYKYSQYIINRIKL